MESKRIHLPQGEVRPILTVRDQAHFAAILRQHRLDLGITLAELDFRAGFHDGYAAHLEQPFTRSGKRSFKLTGMGAIWLQALGLDLAIVGAPSCSSSALGANDDDPTIAPEEHPRFSAR